jgi:predicted dehydrogenase
MTKTRVRVGMLGAGFIGQMHSLAFRNAGMSRAEPAVAAELVALADRDEKLAAEIADRYDWSATTTEWSELLAGDLGLFINAGPNHVHHDASVAAAEAGIAVFCEKPLASSAEEAHTLWKAVDRYGVMHRCAFLHRFIPALQLARQMIQAGELGEVRQFRSTFLLNMLGPDGEVSWRFDRDLAGSGATGDLGSHHIDLARFLVGEVTQVSALAKTWTTDPSATIEHLNDDAFAALALLDNGATAVFEACRTTAAHNLTGRIEIDGTRGSISWSMERLNELVIREPGKGPRVQPVSRPGHPLEGFWLPGGVQGSHPIGWNECFAHQAHDILGLASGKLTHSVAASFEDGYRVAEIVDTIEAAAASGTTLQVNFRP